MLLPSTAGPGDRRGRMERGNLARFLPTCQKNVRNPTRVSIAIDALGVRTY